MDNAIEMCNVTHTFKDKKVLMDINIKIPRGQIFGLLGPSGAGKTTIIRIITGQLKQTYGQVKILDFDSQRLTGKQYQKIGIMLDDFGLYERLSCYDNLRLITQIYGLEKKQIKDVLDSVGLLGDANKMVSKLSKGMRQRLLFARAILTKPEILFLDEPTSGLDPITAKVVHDLILNQAKAGTSIFLTTHNMEEATKLCDKLALLNQGRIMEYGTSIEMCNRYRHKNKVRILLEDDKMVELENESDSAETIYEYVKKGIVKTIHTTEPNLETVFMELTGKELNR